MIASALIESGDIEAARAEFREAMRLDPDLTGITKLKRALGLAPATKRESVSKMRSKETKLRKYFETADQLPSEWELFNAAANAKWDVIIPLLDFNNFGPKTLSTAQALVEQAAWHIGYSKNTTVIPMLMELAKSGSSRVRESSRLSLARLGDADTLMFLRKMKPCSVATVEGDHIKQAGAYLEESLSHRHAQGALTSTRSLLDHATQYLADKEFGRARFLLELLEKESTEPQDARFEPTKLLALAAARMADYRAASGILARVYFSLNPLDKASVAEDLFRWFVLSLPESYHPEFDLQFEQCPNVGVERIEFATNAESFLPAVKEFNHLLGRLGEGHFAVKMHRFIQTEAPANSYFYASNCRYYTVEVALSSSLRDVATKIAERVTTTVTAKLQEIMGTKTLGVKAVCLT